MIVDDQRDVVAWLDSPASWKLLGAGGPAGGGADAETVERISTHGAHVFLNGDRALKLKRAVRFDYMDFSTVEQRERFCRLEIELNRRTAPGIYLGVRRISRAGDGSLAFDGDGETVDWLVEMRRFDQAGLFDRLARDGELTPALIEAAADAVADFHRGLEPRRDHGGAGETELVLDVSVDQSERYVPGLFDASEVAALRTGMREACRRLAPLIEARRADGHVRHCHGDLHLRNICLVDGQPTLFDCIEFNDAFAVTDTLYDLAFLLMDLLHRDLRPLANRALGRYLAGMGALTGAGESDEIGGLALMPLFLAMRASIRAHATATMADDDPTSERGRALAAEARDYLRSAHRFITPPPPRLIAIGGFSGSGKSTIARALAPDIGAAPGALVLRSDVIRKRLFGRAETEPLPQDAYRPEVSERVYAMLGARAAEALAAGSAVIADAVFDREPDRARIADVAARAGVPFDGFWLEASKAALARRIAQRRDDASDADVAVLESQLARGGHAGEWRTVDAGGSIEAVSEAVRNALKGR
ncbi:bifunctional aminoglycoside phosphotransferase/ATP-binding protein [Oceanibacterium hippocampi]|uniref:Phosphotransferase enzyme family protein n=1 Tax=Oceanibacterium hippocampi TaxID=745714 RepID=A0A1Y5SA18_9PROT|nr:bifunctional aminoglycoside phosphotransferase/ATP-binding protein [Oceanibacterium hippocampi]SLN35940.1 Phosphotransferase enzyme family protein [Oceanibacterium hippocampi]